MTETIGSFMVGVGAIIERQDTNEILLLKRSEKLKFNAGMWEFVFGRVNQHESARKGLLREINEEIGFTQVEIIKPVNDFHIYRGKENTAENEMQGIVYWVTSKEYEPRLSREHTEHLWATPEDALKHDMHQDFKNNLHAFLDVKK